MAESRRNITLLKGFRPEANGLTTPMRSTFILILLIHSFCQVMAASHPCFPAAAGNAQNQANDPTNPPSKETINTIIEIKESNPATETSITMAPLTDDPGVESSLASEKEKEGRYLIEEIIIKGNERTRERIILRELPLSRGDSLYLHQLRRKVESGRYNLMNTGLFNFAEVVYEDCGEKNIQLTIHVVERWNIWPLPALELDEPNLNQWLDAPSFSAFNYGINLHASNITGRNEMIRLAGKIGNVQTLDFQLRTPYMGPRQTVRLGLQYKLDRSKRRVYATEENEQLVARLPDDYISNEYTFAGSLHIRPGFYSTHRFGLSFHYHNYADTLLALNPRFGPDGKNRFSFFSAGYSFRRDRRDIIAYPLSGHLIEAGVTKKGLGLLSEENMDVTSLYANVRHYIRLKQQWYAAWSMYGKWSEGTTLSYFDREGLGFNRSLVRGYEQYIIDGHKFFIFKSNIKYNLLPERDGLISFIPYEQFSRIHYALYLNVFADVGVINDRHYRSKNNLANRWLAGGGIGLDFHTYYDIVFRSEFTVNRHGETGFFFHLGAPI